MAASANNICRILVIVNVLAIVFFCIQVPSSSNLKGTTDLFTKENTQKSDALPFQVDEFTATLSKEDLIDENFKLKQQIENLIERRTEVGQLLKENNPFHALGAYKEEYNLKYGMIFFNQSNYGLSHDDDYCETVDLYNLNNLTNIFGAHNFFTDHSNLSLVRNIVMKELGDVFTKEIFKRMKPKPGAEKIYLDYRINNFFTNHANFHWYHQIGHNFLCATQMYNHIPGHTAFVNKGEIIRHLNNYLERYQDRPQCFDRETLFPISYRLYDEKECKTFFSIINSKQYKQSLPTEPLQYLIKVAAGVHKAEGVSLLDEKMTKTLNIQYRNGKTCGRVQQQRLIAQRYISNPLLLADHNKFDFRIYMLIASTNPLIVYYHDGFPRVSLHAYNTSSSDKAAHLTNSALSSQVIKEASEKGEKVENLSANQVKKYKSWNVEDLVDYLLKIGKIKNKKWLDNYLRPAFQKALIHIVRMTRNAFWNQSNVYELNGVDFMLDDDLKLWYIESNPNPFLNSGLRDGFFPTMLFDLFEIQYAYYRSRMQRVLEVVRRFQKAQNSNEEIDYSEWREEYARAEKNRLEPEYKISKNNSFKLIMDENLEGHKAYFGHIKKECI